MTILNESLGTDSARLLAVLNHLLVSSFSTAAFSGGLQLQESNNSSSVDVDELADIVSSFPTEGGQSELFLKLQRYFSVTFDVRVDIQGLLAVAETEKRRGRIYRLLQSYAPFGLLNSLYGLSQDEYKAIRKELGLSDPGGRPRALSPEDELAVLNCWNQRVSNYEWEDLGDAVMAIHRMTNCRIRDFWPYLSTAFSLVIAKCEPHYVLPKIVGISEEYKFEKTMRGVFEFDWNESLQSPAGQQICSV